MKLKSKRPSLKSLVAKQGIDYNLAKAYQKALGQVKATIGRFARKTRELFGGEGVSFEIPQSVYQMNFRKRESADSKNEYLMARLLELRQMQSYAGLASYHSEQLDRYMENVALAMGREGYTPAQVQRFINRYKKDKEKDEELYIKGQPPEYNAFRFVSRTGGADITMRYMSLSKYLEDDEADMEADILAFQEAIEYYLGLE